MLVGRVRLTVSGACDQIRQFFSVNPANLVGDAGGSIGIVETGGNTLDVTMDVKYGTTDASGPLTVKGEFTCTETA